jgi:DNA-binding phage protein
LAALLKQLEVEGLVNNFLEKSGLSSQDLYKSLKGDIAVVVSDLGMSQPEPQSKT